MIDTTLQSIDKSILITLLRDRVSEDKTLELKESMPRMDTLFGEVCGFANSSAGDIIIGIKQTPDGKAQELVGITIENLDQEKLKLEQSIRTAFDPPISSFEIHPVELKITKYILIIRVQKSWNGPHRLKNNNIFYGRHSGGKYPMDVDELRVAFNQYDIVSNRIRRFHTNRLNEIFSGRTPVSLQPGGMMILHIIPFAAYVTKQLIDVKRTFDIVRNNLYPLGDKGGSIRYNLDGLLFYSSEYPNLSSGYTQLYRNGIIESVEAKIEGRGDKGIPSIAYEQEVISALPRFTNALRALDIPLPYYAYLSFAGIKDFKLVASRRHSATLFRDEILDTPEIEINDYNFEATNILKPIFDIVWNAFGYPSSANYNKEGNWNG